VCGAKNAEYDHDGKYAVRNIADIPITTSKEK
jgi:hypothetical protein